MLAPDACNQRIDGAVITSEGQVFRYVCCGRKAKNDVQIRVVRRSIRGFAAQAVKPLIRGEGSSDDVFECLVGWVTSTGAKDSS